MSIVFFKLFDIMRRRGISRKDLVEKAGISQPTFQSLKHGGVVKTDTIDKLCEVLGVQPGDLMEYQQEVPPEEGPMNERLVKVLEGTRREK